MVLNNAKILSVSGYNGKIVELDGIPFLIVKDCDWAEVSGGKLQPTQSYPNGKDSFAMSKESYFQKNEFYWLEHEVGHCIYYFEHPEKNFEYLPYPDNEVERFAFLNQFKQMKKNGLSMNEAFELIKKAYIQSEDWEKIPELETFLLEIINQAYYGRK